jgi:hypothetical protein
MSEKTGDKRVLSINISDFALNNKRTTRKKTNGDNVEKIKIKSQTPKTKNDTTLKKKSILKMIRQHQEERYKKLFEDNSKKKSLKVETALDDLNSGFKEAKTFLQNLSEKKVEDDKLKNYTLRRQPQLYESINPNLVEKPASTYGGSAVSVQETTTRTNSPLYGCLKNGNLPTYRHFVNKTRMNKPSLIVGGELPNLLNIPQQITLSQPAPVLNTTTNINSSIPKPNGNLLSFNGGSNITPLSNTNANVNMHTQIAEQKINQSLKRISEMKQTATKLKDLKRRMISIPKRRKTIRRTYKIGKSSVFPRISVLVSNKTLRNNINNKSQLLKQVDISEIKKYLIKRGFIKVGSTAPNDVLRKMYEESVLMCGELQNHNPDNLLYNYLNDNNNSSDQK